ncbi:MAG TPA: heavy metal-binding domain-containing protein, partial [Methanosarcina sp.]|nr:heavy metal-binding domain-containing protein [Methanosarcina sp.]
MIIATTDTIAGKEIIQTLGMARGSTIQAKHIGKDIMS